MFAKRMMQCLVVLSFLLMSTLSLADFTAIGSAVVPGLQVRYASDTEKEISTIYVSNTTNTDITCKVTVFKQDGTDITSSYVTVYTLVSSIVTYVTVTDGEFSLPAHSTRIIQISTTSLESIRGYAVVEWGCDNAPMRKAIIASRAIWMLRASGGSYAHGSEVNGGQIF